MLNQNILKQVNLLYVEDDQVIRQNLVSIFEKLFKNVFSAEDGSLGLKLFKELKEKNRVIDIIISDINMPNMSGLEMLSKIKEVDNSVPFILTTAHNESEYLIEAIKLGVSHYAVKPIKTADVLKQVQDLCEARLYEKTVVQKQNELEQYLNIIDKIAMVSKFNLAGMLIATNQIYCDEYNYEEFDTIGKDYNFTKHPDVDSAIYNEIWSTIKKGDIWKGKLKNISKNNEVRFINSFIFPVFDTFYSKISSYVMIGFSVTEDENQSRDFRKKVIQNIQETKQREQEYKNRIKSLENKLSMVQDIDLLHEALVKEKDKALRYQSQVKHYENQIVKIKDDADERIKDVIDRPAKILADFNQIKVKYDASVSLNHRINEELQKREAALLQLSESVQEQAKIIKDLKEVIVHREKEIYELKRDLEIAINKPIK